MVNMIALLGLAALAVAAPGNTWGEWCATSTEYSTTTCYETVTSWSPPTTTTETCYETTTETCYETVTKWSPPVTTTATTTETCYETVTSTAPCQQTSQWNDWKGN